MTGGRAYSFACISEEVRREHGHQQQRAWALAWDAPAVKADKDCCCLRVHMQPKNIPKSMMEGEIPSFLPSNIKCPPGTVLIKRSTKEDLIMTKRLKALGLHYPTTSNFPTADPNIAFATVQYNRHNFGAKTTMNVWGPSTSADQASFGNLWITNGPTNDINVLQAGWGIMPPLFSSNLTRLLIYWTADGHKFTGCYNYLCPGFVHVHRQITIGLVLNQLSVYNGTQKDIEIGIFRDGEWWLKYFNQFVGYWPQKLFVYMYGGANNVVWGGKVFSLANKRSPAMGSGHFPKDGLQNKVAYCKGTQIWDNVNLFYPPPDQLVVSTSMPDCYEAQLVDGAAPNTKDLFYGGPGQCKIQG
ncbi:hypothetical protein F3Y22_tig00117007pilonHSYRG00089 [Hibiscus syriacus]|uniref:Neprosin PEP catalytic domain-containing protein n=1 Tax=Hibiscus syriacus TaxID=106335 RepID=A0A6A2WCY6_HIBSY|nr:hypothetical protein F3Y22_tig00117007pilonHSYRG00089 [Hibiscus syriacus]